MFKGRILVVDDLSDWRTTLTGLLTDSGYVVSPAASRAEALDLMAAGRFHVAVLDVRLDETDSDNRDGLTLMRDIKEKDPTTAVIILTAYSDVRMYQMALRPSREGPLAFDFLEKADADQLPLIVRRALEEYVKVDFELRIKDANQTLLQLARRIYRFLEPRQKAENWIEEIEELLRKLFYSREQIELNSIRKGYSKAAVFEVIPYFQDKARGETRIVKIGGYRLVENEVQRHESIRGRIGANRLPERLSIARTRSLSGIIYTLVGLGSSEDFATFFQRADEETLNRVLYNLFEETCFPWQRQNENIEVSGNLKKLYATHLNLNLSSLDYAVTNIMGGRHPFRSDTNDSRYIWLNDAIKLLSPLNYIKSRFPITNTCIGFIHGDLHGYNVLIDRHFQTWLIDFADTGKGPVLQDYASFETFLRLSMVKSRNWQMLYEWVTALDTSTDVFAPDPCTTIPNNRTIVKVHDAVKTVRRLARKRCPQATQTEYRFGLLCNALKLVSIMNLPAEQRDHALIMSAVIAEQLEKYS